jgi:hypothetical protein
MQEVAHGGLVPVGGKQWQASFETDCLCLTTTTQTEDKKEQTANRIANIKREVEARQEEVKALATDLARVEGECETVPEGREGMRGKQRGDGLMPVCLVARR